MKVLIGLMGLMVLIEGTWLFQNKPLEQSIADGKEIYQDFCLQCHLDTGKGVSGVFPPLAQSDYLLNDLDLSIKGIKYGMSGPITVNGEEYNGVMQNQGLDDVEIADVMNYVINSWGNKSKEVITPERVASITE
ncbi:MAG: Cytochrome c-552 [Flavobacteriaceae bacterium]|nr:MAG: Cytochrome c-552 [Flavobacteriaceae bacterium]|tara:strand:- start:185 stop:586 length:402 start_codon:yes stop_codon:yes gene_type:complete